MSLMHIFILALIQGITEFLPISSSAHLILFPQLTGVADQGVAIDVSVHVGTLLAVMIYFRSDVMMVIRGLPDLARGRLDSPGARMAFLLAVATVPVIVLGLVLKLTGLVDAMRSVALIGWTMLIFGVVLYAADKLGTEARRAEGWTLRDAIILGLWQAIALIPGTSRSGATITGARFLGFERHDAARLSMLMSIPTIIASGAITALDLVETANAQAAIDGAIGAAISFVAALFALKVMMRFLAAVSFTPYVIYRVVLGMALLWVAYS
ncbi:undecaprenyl-diphosphate phosphatase [Pararhodobacter zhoushanensis]|uniref:Undecaprenyl-diphosphatase n=1 Tax=Pararhodobacter zhoushanensis TaxID=2479545 RepID=A0ABT3GUE8_9RHOB|nr:undecaprenyl-diphosphate phosphatase [Pararhodobacter zhoushanensis]MCW1931162.1 undecaprenyl-diphosphate phosphatase [Pararhodobacter zhoushanensis]